MAYAQSGFQSPHHFSTAAVTLLQSNENLNRGWLALSYRPTAACIGMAMLLGIRRIVWRQGDINHSATIANGVIAYTNGAPAILSQPPLNGNAYVLPDPLPNLRRAFPVMGHLVNNVFRPPHGTANLIQSMHAADDVVKDNTCLLLAFAIASIGHGSRNNNRNRTAAYDGQNIASVLVDSNYQIVGWGINTNTSHASLHGEINLIRSYQANNMNALPAGGKLFTTLEPCAMCAGMIVHTAGEGNNFEVVSGQRDEQVGYSALRNPNGRDGCMLNPRTVRSTISKMPLLPHREIGEYMTISQWQHSPMPAVGQPLRLMPTTRYLERHGDMVMSDAVKLLDKTAVMWIPSAQRAAWRTQRDQFLLHVKASIRS